VNGYRPGQLGESSVLGNPRRLKRLYLRWFGIPDVRTHLTGSYLLPAMVRLGGERILDVGCGSGLLTCLVAATLPDALVSGWDRDANAIEYARKLAAAHRVDNVRFEVVDAERTAFDHEPRFAAVISLAVLQFVSDVPGALTRFSRLIRPGGHLVLQVPADRPPVTFFMRLPALGARLPDFDEARGGFSETECRTMIDAAGLEILELIPVIKRPTRLAKDVFYLAQSIHRSLATLVCPLLNWITVRDARFRGAGAGYFIVARKPAA
jgi:2-polyprenyl-3-methyl-5-hydroxy-6-metoxy-1,4-benzoquinol methylase